MWGERRVSQTEIDNLSESSYQIFKKILENYYNSNPIEPTQGTLETFEFLRYKGIKIALSTGFYRAVTQIILKKLG